MSNNQKKQIIEKCIKKSFRPAELDYYFTLAKKQTLNDD